MKHEDLRLGVSHYRPEVDGLRALAIIPVVLGHAGIAALSGGYVGVDVFFVISGYLIGGIVFSELQSGTFSLADFYERRARRILPALFVMLGLSYTAGWFLMSPARFEDFAQNVVAVDLFVSNIVFWKKAGYFAVESNLNPLLHTWSLAVEEQFYLFFPLLLLLLQRRRKQLILTVLIAVALVSLAAAEYARHRDADFSFFLLPTRTWELLFGAIVAIGKLDKLQIGRVGCQIGSAAGIALYLLSLRLFDRYSPHPGLITLLPVLSAVLILMFARPQTVAGRLLAMPPLVGIGLISYSIYLLHQPLFVSLRLYKVEGLTTVEIAFALVLCFAASYMSWRFIEQPFRNRRIISTRLVGSFCALATAVAAGLGLAGWFSGGVLGRLSPSLQGVMAQIKRDEEARKDGIRLGKCHFRERSAGFMTVLSQWNCLPAAAPRLLVYGDSHAADKAWALRSAGMDVGNLTGAGCALVPRPNSSDCNAMLEHALNLARDRKIDGIILAHRWSRGDIRSEQLRSFTSFWKAAGVPVMVFTPMPEFTNFDLQLMRAGRTNDFQSSLAYDQALLSQTEKKVTEAAQSSGFAVLNTADLLCQGRRDTCQSLQGGSLLTIDYGHLSIAGAKALGTTVVNNASWNNWVASLKRP